MPHLLIEHLFFLYYKPYSSPCQELSKKENMFSFCYPYCIIAEIKGNSDCSQRYPQNYRAVIGRFLQK